VAAALRSGAQHVDAIEIDPAILLAGKTIIRRDHTTILGCGR